MGCFSQTQPEVAVGIEGVDIVLGTSGRDQLVTLVERFLASRQPINIVGDIAKERNFESLTVAKFENRKRGVLKIQDGCNNFCTFCIIPWARGRIRSEDPVVVIANAKELVANGHIELVLTGIHTGAYGEDLEDFSFAMLLKELVQIEELVRLRISSIEATQLTDEVLAILAGTDKIAHHLHIPIQSGAGAILKTMNRKYTLAEFETNIARIRQALPSVSITTDIIVGFPGETEELFQESLATVKRIGFSELHVFPYSVRNGTPASRMEQQVPEITKTMRVAEMIAASEQLAEQYAATHESQILDVIVERIKDGIATGHTSNYLKIKFPVTSDFNESLVQVKITKTGYPECVGEIAKKY